jgi:uncharacterized protein (DUF342 family)
MKKIWILLTIGVLTTAIVGCTARQQDNQIDQITSLAEILAKTAELPQQYQRKEITLDQLNAMTLELQDKYTELTKNPMPPNKEIDRIQNNLDEQFELIKTTIDNAKEVCDLPDRAEKL